MPHLNWIDELKLAIINENIDKIEILSKTIPQFNTLKESEEALSLIEQASLLVKKEQDKISTDLQKLKNTKAYLIT